MFDKYLSVSIIPVAVLKTEEELRCIAELCLEYLPALELTMRTEFSYKALEILATDYPSLPYAAATVLDIDQAEKVLNLGANIIVSPGFQKSLAIHAIEKGYAFIPGVSTPSEVQQCLEFDFKYIKFFPAAVCGGVTWLQTMESVYEHTGVKFIPLGGINSQNITEYLSLKNVAACGGTWLCARELLDTKNWSELKRRFKEASKIIKEIKK